MTYLVSFHPLLQPNAMSDLEEELLGLAEDDPHKRKRSSKPKSSA